MSADKRTVSTDALETLGTIIDNTAGRDAIHLAVEPCVAGEILYPGQQIGIKDGKASTKAKKKLGIVDPFLERTVFPDQMFWLVVFPRTITSLRHVWTHPDFEEVKEESENDLPTSAIDKAEEWLRNWCSTNDVPNFDRTITEAIDASESDEECVAIYGHDTHASIPNEFWNQLEIYTGKKLKNRPGYFTCSC